MPFDALTFTPAITDTPSLEALSYALRHQETWPVGFEWDYSNCTTCAMGLTAQLWSAASPPPSINAVPRWAFDHLHMPPAASCGIFLRLGGRHHVRHANITPEHVADAIDAYLATV